MTTGDDLHRVTRLIGVYDADGTLRGEVTYWVGARLGRAHCSLCDITHGMFRAKAEWSACQAALPVPFDTYHRDDQPAEVRAAAGGRAPVVAAETAAGVVVLLDGEALERCDGDIDRMVEAIEASLWERGLSLGPTA